MTLMDESAWRGKIFLGGWTAGSGGDAPVTEPATGQEIGRVGLATPADVTRAAQIAAAAQAGWAAAATCAARATSAGLARPTRPISWPVAGSVTAASPPPVAQPSRKIRPRQAASSMSAMTTPAALCDVRTTVLTANLGRRRGWCQRRPGTMFYSCAQRTATTGFVAPISSSRWNAGWR